MTADLDALLARVSGAPHSTAPLAAEVRELVAYARQLEAERDESRTLLAHVVAAWADVRDTILHETGPLEVNDVLRRLDEADPSDDVTDYLEKSDTWRSPMPPDDILYLSGADAVSALSAEMQAGRSAPSHLRFFGPRGGWPVCEGAAEAGGPSWSRWLSSLRALVADGVVPLTGGQGALGIVWYLGSDADVHMCVTAAVADGGHRWRWQGTQQIGDAVATVHGPWHEADKDTSGRVLSPNTSTRAALDTISAACGRRTWNNPGEVASDVLRLVAKRGADRGHVARLEAEAVRLHDLVRHQRGALHDAELITDEEYAALASDHAAVARLESYDAIRARVERLERKRADLRTRLADIVRLLNLDPATPWKKVRAELAAIGAGHRAPTGSPAANLVDLDLVTGGSDDR